MAYASNGSTGNRAATGIAVALIEAGVLYALVTGLAVHFTAPEEKPPLAGYQVPTAPPPPLPTFEPADPKPQIVPETRDPVARRLPQEPTVATFPTNATSDGFPTAGSGGSGTLPYDPPQPQPSFVPREARPRTAPANWVSPSDYPARDLREGNQGLTRFLLSVGADGSVLGCEITASSGSPSLDAATCRHVTRRARFNAATDGQGAKVTGTYAGSIRWQIPRD